MPRNLNPITQVQRLLAIRHQVPLVHAPGSVATEQLRLMVPVSSCAIVKPFPDFETATMVKSRAPPRTETEPWPGGMAVSSASPVVPSVELSVQLEYVC